MLNQSFTQKREKKKNPILTQRKRGRGGSRLRIAEPERFRKKSTTYLRQLESMLGGGNWCGFLGEEGKEPILRISSSLRGENRIPAERGEKKKKPAGFKKKKKHLRAFNRLNPRVLEILALRPNSHKVGEKKKQSNKQPEEREPANAGRLIRNLESR